MKRFILIVTLFSVVLNASAVPACPEPAVVTNADGTKLTIQLHGDEFYDFTTTADGYTVIKTPSGNYEYAKQLNGQLVATGIIAHDFGMRTSAEIALTSTTPKYLVDKAETKAKRTKAIMLNNINNKHKKVSAMTGFKGLVILVSYNDKDFHMANPQSFYNHLINDRNYTGYNSDPEYSTDNPLFSKWGNYTGSVRDYFYDNSMGQFDPQFDVVGPIKVNYSMTQGRKSSALIFLSAVSKLSSDYGINYWDYDYDGDGCVDLIYFIVAGFGSNYTGNNSNYLWPYATHLTNPLTGKKIMRVACSTEYYGWEDGNNYYPDGIGTICHEFSHCLGVRDLYDTDYEENGSSNDPGIWDIMASGSYLNSGRTPAGYSLYDRYAMGFTQPQVINKLGAYTLEPLGESNSGFIIQSPNAQEKFFLENRQKLSKWDAYLPGTGMLVCRMDSSDATVWNDNKINCDSTHNYYEILRAGGVASISSSSDPFPGTNAITFIAGNNKTTPNLRTWDGKDCDVCIRDISENSGNITFNLKPTVVIGDVNLDGDVTIGDVTAVYNIILGINEDHKDTADVTGDNEITVADVTFIYSQILGI